MMKMAMACSTIGLICSLNSHAATTLMASGHAGIVGQYSLHTLPDDVIYSSFRVPVGLLLQASPSDKLSLYLGLEYAYNNYPESPVLLGNTSSQNNSNGTQTALPFASAVEETTPYGQKTDTPVLSQAYFAYQTNVGLVQAGRMPRDWGLGMWLNDRWTPYGGTISTSDAVALINTFQKFDVSLYLEKYGEGAATSKKDDANAYTLEARLHTDPSDVPSSGISREVGVLFSKFEHDISNTKMNILDVYTKLYFNRFYMSGEVLYPTGSTQSPDYQTLGGASACEVTMTDVEEGSQTCVSQDLSALAALVQMKWQVGGAESASVASTEHAQLLLPTAERLGSHTLGLWAGYASGGSNQFEEADAVSSDNTITAIQMNPNIQPSFLMFNNTMPPVNGMPMGSITNTTFVRVDYTFENPSFGLLSPVLVWGVLNETNKSYNGSNGLCTEGASADANSAVNHLCVGGSRNLGVELDLAYRYTTLDRVTIGTDIGYWFVGSAWQEYGESKPQGVLGMRVSLGTEF